MFRRKFLKLAGGVALVTSLDVYGKRLYSATDYFDSKTLLGKYVTPRKNIEVLAPHYTWYTEERWFSGPEYPFTTPIRGYYSSADPNIAAAQNTEKEQYGIGVDLVAWWGPRAISTELFKEGYLNASNFHDRPFCFLYEITGRLNSLDKYGYFDFNNPEIEKGFLEDLEYLEKNYFWYPNYYRINGKPVIYIWWQSIKNFDEVSKRLKDKVFLIGSIDFLFPPKEQETIRINSLNWYDAISYYGIAPIRIAKQYGKLSDEFISDYIKSVFDWSEIIMKYNPHVELILPLQYAYHDHRGDFDQADSKSRIFHHDYTQSLKFTKISRLLAENLDCIKRIMLVSYNEHWEGHGAEPSLEYGNYWLSLIERFFKKNEPIYQKLEFLNEFTSLRRNKSTMIKKFHDHF